jgi:hypothetical protein
MILSQRRLKVKNLYHRRYLQPSIPSMPRTFAQAPMTTPLSMEVERGMCHMSKATGRRMRISSVSLYLSLSVSSLVEEM